MSENVFVISGMSGRYPLADNTDEFAYNLYNGIDMVTEDDSRWPTDLYGVNHRMGKVKDCERFDVAYFTSMQQNPEQIDPQARMLLETTYEAIVDAGLNPQSLRGTQTGVYLGLSVYPNNDAYPEDIQPDQKSRAEEIVTQILGNNKGMFANRISFYFDFNGPSLVTDTHCSASLTALNIALMDLKQGHIENAIVCGSHMLFEPFLIQIFQENGLISSRGVSAVLDRSADGFVKSEGVVSLLLQSQSRAKRIYARVLSARVNNDGKKTIGKFHPSAESQQQLMTMSYKEANVDPLALTYIEGHMTGTIAGDPQEVKAIYNAYCYLPKRKHVLPLGLLKSNTGHMEGSSGVASVTKVLIAYENECLPANINLKHIRDECKQYCPPLYPNTDNIEYTPGIAAVNNFGVGGVNAHLILEPNYKLSDKDSLKIAETVPRIVNICCRTEDSIKSMFAFITNNTNKISRDFLALLADTMKVTPDINSGGFPYRGSIIMKKMSEEYNEMKYEYKTQYSVNNSKTVRPVWFLFPGLGGQWPAMAKALMPIKIFADKVEECHQILEEFGIDLKYLLLSEDKTTMSTMTSKFCSTTALEICLFEVLKSLDITPDGIIGHSFGEIACAYADGCLTTKEALVVTYFRGFITESDYNIPRGLMAAVGLSREETKELCPKGVYVVCNNAKDSVVISGPTNEMIHFIEYLTNNSIFCRRLQSSQIPYHSQYLKSSAKVMTESIQKYLLEPRLRSRKWISTSLLDSEPEEKLRFASAEYFVHNLLSPVHFYEKLQELPSDAIVIELSPHSVFGKIVEQTIESVDYLSLIKKDSNDTNLDYFLQTIAKLYELGLSPSIENLYPKVEWPVARGTQSISSLWKWDHSKQLKLDKYPDTKCRFTSSDMNVCIDLQKKEENFYSDHKVDGNAIFPATGYVMLVWRQFAASMGRIWNEVPVQFEDIQFRRAIFLSDSSVTKIKVRYFANTGDFAIVESGEVTCVGRIALLNEQTLCARNVIHENSNRVIESEIRLERDDIYKELRIIGFDYGVEFRRLKNIRTKDFKQLFGTIEWNGNFVTFLDSMLQSMAFTAPLRQLSVPVIIKALKIDPKLFFNEIEAKRVYETDEYPDIMILNDKSKANVQRFCRFRSDIEFSFNSELQLIQTNGIEINRLISSPILRKTESTYLILDSYEFVANEDMNAIEVYDKQNIIKYLESCKALAVKLKSIGLTEMKCDFNYQLLSEEKIKELKNGNKENHILFRIFDKMINEYTEQSANNNNNFIEHSINCLQNDNELDLNKDITNQVQKNERMFRTVLNLFSENQINKNAVKILEINLSKDTFANEVTDIVANYHVYSIAVEYKLVVKSLNEDYKQQAIQWNPRASDSMPNIAVNDLIVIRDTQDLWPINTNQFVRRLNENLDEKAFLLTVFKYKFTEPELALNSLFGKNCLNDSDLEKRINDFVMTAKNNGLNLICRKSDSISTMTLLFRKVTEKPIIPERNQIIRINTKYEQWFEALKQKLISFRVMDGKAHNVWLIGNELGMNGILGLINCLRSEPGGQYLRCIFDFDNTIDREIDFNCKPFSDILNNDLFINVIKEGKLGTYRHLSLPKDYDKTVSNQYFLNTTQRKDLSNLQWFDASSIVENEEVFDFNNNLIKQIPIRIYSSGVGFHDVMIATGRIPVDKCRTKLDFLVGCEFVGRRVDTGVRVMGFELSGCYATSIYAKESLITPIPDHWSMDEAVTILTTYGTVWYGLIEKANMKKGESILIHSGAGGIGQSAINVCKHYECDIYCTVGTEEKKQFLIKEYNIPENRIFCSRDIRFKNQIMELTKGKGVDLVLNSLAGEKLDASYDCVANMGRFVELGKYDFLLNKKLQTYDFLRDISFISVTFDLCLAESRDFVPNYVNWMHKNSKNGCVKPINRTVFNANEVEKAFRYMTTGRHIGKIVIRIRDEESDRKPLKAIKAAKDMSVKTKTYFNPNKAYIITGGLGGFGLELVHWMLFKGAKNFVLTSRQGIRTDYQKYIINRLKAFGELNKIFDSIIIVSTHDCLTIEGTQQVIKEAEGLAPIGGLFHSTIVLNDVLLQNQTLDKFCESIDCKHKIFANFDALGRNLSYSLDYFVVFSSLSSGLGNAGQTNYAFGNSICERICEQRRRDGLHGLAIQFGPIGEVGVFSDKDQLLLMTNLEKQRILSCCDVLDTLLAINQPIVTSYIKRIRSKALEDKPKMLYEKFCLALGIDPDNTPEYLILGEIGMESMFAVEMQHELEKRCNLVIPLHLIKSISVRMLRAICEGNVDVLKPLMKARNSLLKYKFVIPIESHTHLNGVRTGKPVYFLPPIEITFSALKELAEKIDRPVIGLNWTRDMSELKSIQELTQYYWHLLNELSPNGNYDIFGCFDSAFVVSDLLRRAPVDKAVIVDVLSDMNLNHSLTDEELLISFFKRLTHEMPEQLIQRFLREMKSESDSVGKVRRISNSVKDIVGGALIANDLEEILHLMLKRSQSLQTYVSDMKSQSTELKYNSDKKWSKTGGKLVVIKAFEFNKIVADFEEYVQQTRDVYFRPQNDESTHQKTDRISVQCVDGIPSGANSNIIGEQIIKNFN